MTLKEYVGALIALGGLAACFYALSPVFTSGASLDDIVTSSRGFPFAVGIGAIVAGFRNIRWS